MNLNLSNFELKLSEEKIDELISEELFLLCTELYYSKDDEAREKDFEACKTMYHYYSGYEYNG